MHSNLCQHVCALRLSCNDQVTQIGSSCKGWTEQLVIHITPLVVCQ